MEEISAKHAFEELQLILQQFLEEYESPRTNVFAKVCIKSDFLNSFGINLHVEEGTIDELETDIDVLSFLKQEQGGNPFKISIKTLTLRVSNSPPTTKIAVFQERRKALALILGELFSSLSGVSLSELLLKATISIENVRIEYYDPVENYSLVFLLSKMQQIPTKGSNEDRVSNYKFDDFSIQIFEGKVPFVPASKESKNGASGEPSSDISAHASEAKQPPLLLNTTPEQQTAKASDPESYFLSPISGTIRVVNSANEDDENSSWNLKASITLTTPIELRIHRHTIRQLYYLIHRINSPLFTDTRGQHMSLDLLRWYPVKGHEKEYWKFSLRKALGTAIKNMAAKQNLDAEEWSKVDGLLAPFSNKEKYIQFYVRSLNLVDTVPLSTAEYSEKKQLEALHAADTILLWRTEAKIRFTMERPSASQGRLERQELKELKAAGILGTLFTRFPKVEKTNELTDEQKKEAYERALWVHVDAMKVTKLKEVNVNVSTKDKTATIRFYGNSTVTLEAEEFRFTYDFTPIRASFNLELNRFQQLPNSRGQRSLFAHQSGIVQLFFSHPTDIDKSAKDPQKPTTEFRVFLQFVSITSLIGLVNYYSDFFLTSLSLFEKVKRGYARQRKAQGEPPALENNIYVECQVSDSVIIIPSEPVKNTMNEFTLQAGNIKRSSFEAPRANILIELFIDPVAKKTKLQLSLLDLKILWGTRLLSRKKRKRVHEDSFQEILVHRIDGCELIASMEGGLENRGERIEVSIQFHQMRVRLSQRIIGQILRMISSQISSREASHVFRNVKKGTPFSFRLKVSELDLAPEQTSEQRERASVLSRSSMGRDGQTNSPAFLLSLRDVNFKSSEVRTLRKTRTGSKVDSSSFNFQKFMTTLTNHLMDGLIASQGTISAAHLQASVQAAHDLEENIRLLAPALERLRSVILDSSDWDRNWMDGTLIEVKDLLTFDVLKKDGPRLRGGFVEFIEMQLSQALSQSVLESMNMQSQVLTSYEEPSAETKDNPHALPQSVWNPGYLVIRMVELRFCQDMSPRVAGAVALAEHQEKLANLPRAVLDGVALTQADWDLLTSIAEQEFFFRIRNFEASFRERGHPFFCILLDDFESVVTRTIEGDSDPNYSYKSFRLEFDVRLLKHLVHVWQHRKESSVASETGNEISVLLFEISHLLNSYAVSSSRGHYKNVTSVQMSVRIDNFRWKFVQRLETHKEFNLQAHVLWVCPYALFSPLLTSSQHVILIRGKADFTFTRRRLQVGSSTPEELLKRSDDFTEIVTMKGELEGFEMMHATPKDPHRRDRSNEQRSIEEWFERRESHLKLKQEVEDLEKSDAQQKLEESRLEEVYRLEAESKAISRENLALLKNLSKKNPKMRIIASSSTSPHPVRRNSDAAPRVVPVKVEQQLKPSLQLEPVSTQELDQFFDDLLRPHENGDREHKTNDGDLASHDVSDPSDRNPVLAEEYDLPPLPQKYPLSTSEIDNYINESQIIAPVSFTLRAEWQASALMLHSTREEAKSTRKIAGVRMHVWLEIPEEIALNISERDFKFLLALYHQINEEPPANNPAENQMSSEQSKFSIRPEWDFELNAKKTLTLLFLDSKSDLKGHNPVLSLKLSSLFARASLFNTRTALQVDTTLSAGYGMQPSSNGVLDLPAEAAHIVPLFRSCPLTFKASQEYPSGTRKHSNSEIKPSYASELIVRDEVHLCVAPSFFSVALSRIYPFLKYTEGLLPSRSNFTWEERAPSFRLRNSTGTAVWISQMLLGGVFSDIVSDGQTLTLEENKLQNLELTLDGHWDPPMQLELRPDFHRSHTLTAVAGPGFERLPPKCVELVCETFEEQHEHKNDGDDTLSEVGSVSSRRNSVITDHQSFSFSPGEWRRENSARAPKSNHMSITIDVHSTVSVRNLTEEALEVLSLPLEPGVSRWLPVMVAATGSIQLRPSNEFSWSTPVRFQPAGGALTDGVNSASARDKSEEDKKEDVSYASAECVHNKTRRLWCYGVKITRLEDKQITNIEICSPIVIENCLPCPLEVSITRAALRSIYFFLDSPQVEHNEYSQPNSRVLRPGERNTEHVEIGRLAENVGTWNVYGSSAYGKGVLTIRPTDTPRCKVKNLHCSGSFELSAGEDASKGFLLQDPLSNHDFRIHVTDLLANTEEGKVFRRIRLHCDLVFVDRTQLQLMFSEDRETWVTGHHTIPNAPVVGGDNGEARIIFNTQSRVPPSLRTEEDILPLYLSTALARRWSLPLDYHQLVVRSHKNSTLASDHTHDVKGSTPESHAHYPHFTLRVPVALGFLPVLSSNHPSPNSLKADSEVAKLYKGFVCEVIVQQIEQPPASKILLPAPTLIAFTPRVKIINQMGCAITVRQFAPHNPLPQDYELPLFIPANRTSPLIFFCSDLNHSSVPLQPLYFMPTFIPENQQSDSLLWEWSESVDISKARQFSMSFHTLTFDQRLVCRITIDIHGPYHTITLTNEPFSSAWLKIQNQTSRCSIRFSQKLYGLTDELQSRSYWQTLHAEAGSVSFAWDSINYIAPTDQTPPGIQVLQRPPILRLRLYAAEEAIECEVDLEKARAGLRKVILLSGSQPDVLVHTRTELSTGAVVLIVSDYHPSRNLSLAAFESEERQFIDALLHQSAEFVMGSDSASSSLFPPLKPSETRVGAQALQQVLHRRRRQLAIVTLLEIKVSELRQLTFSPGVSDIIFIMTFGKSTRKIIVPIDDVLKGNLPHEKFFYNAHHNPSDFDFDRVYVDLYERHPSNGTILKCTATIREVHDMLSSSNVVRVGVIPSNTTNRDILPVESDASSSIIVFEISVPAEANTSYGLPGTQLMRFEFECTSIRLSLVDAKFDDVLALVSKKDGIDITKAYDKLVFVSAVFSQPSLVFAQSNSHELFRFLTSNVSIDKKFASDAERAELAALHPLSEVEYRLPSTPVSINILNTAVKENSTQLSLVLLSKLAAIPRDPRRRELGLITVVDGVSLTLKDCSLKLDQDVLLRILAFLEQVDLSSIFQVSSGAITSQAVHGLQIQALDLQSFCITTSFETTWPREDSEPVSTAKVSKQLKQIGNIFSKTLLGAARSNTAEAQETKRQRELEAQQAKAAAQSAKLRRLFTRHDAVVPDLRRKQVVLQQEERLQQSVVAEMVSLLIKHIYDCFASASVTDGLKKLNRWEAFEVALPLLSKKIHNLQARKPTSNVR